MRPGPSLSAVEGEEGWKLGGMGSPGRRRMGLEFAMKDGRRRKTMGVNRVDGTALTKILVG